MNHQAVAARLLLGALVVSGTAIAAGQSSMEVRSDFIYGKDNDSGVLLKICPDKATRRANPVLAKHECFIARNVKSMSSLLGIKEPQSGDDATDDKFYYCDEYDGNGTFSFSAFKVRTQQDEEGGNITIADANIDSVRDIRLTSKHCGTLKDVKNGLPTIKLTGADSSSTRNSASVSAPTTDDAIKAQLRAANAADARKDYATEWRIYTPLMKQGIAPAVLNGGVMQAKGHGTPKDVVRAYANFTLAMTAPDRNVSETAARYRDILVREMTPSQMRAAQQLLASNSAPHATAEQMRQVQETVAAHQQHAASATTGSPERVSYATIFKTNLDGSVSPRMPIRLFGMTMSGSVTFTRGVSFNGVDVAAMQGKDVEIVRGGEFVEIRRFFP